MTNFEITNEAINEVKINNKAHYNSIYKFSISWVKNQFKAFTSDDLKREYYLKGYLKPNEPRVFGAVFRELSKSKLIFNTEKVQKSNDKKCHQRLQTLWISREFSQKQQNNRKQKHQTLELFK